MSVTRKIEKKSYQKPRIVHAEKIEARAGGCGKASATITACQSGGLSS